MLKLVIFLISYYITCPLVTGLESFVKHQQRTQQEKEKTAFVCNTPLCRLRSTLSYPLEAVQAVISERSQQGQGKKDRACRTSCLYLCCNCEKGVYLCINSIEIILFNGAEKDIFGAEKDKFRAETDEFILKKKTGFYIGCRK